MMGVLVVSTVILICVFNQLRLVVAILETAADFVEEVTSALWVPPVIFIVMTIFYAFWLVVAVYLYSTGS